MKTMANPARQLPRFAARAPATAGRALRLLALFGLLLPAGCAALLPRYETPRLEVQGVQLLGGDFRRQRLRVHVLVDNPNARELAVRSVSYELELGGTPLASGQNTEPFVVPAKGRGEFDLDVEADFAQALRIVGEHLREGQVEYRVLGRLRLDSGWLPELPFSGRGQLQLPR
jgi:LEA14-like dessication related protein